VTEIWLFRGHINEFVDALDQLDSSLKGEARLRAGWVDPGEEPSDAAADLVLVIRPWCRRAARGRCYDARECHSGREEFSQSLVCDSRAKCPHSIPQSASFASRRRCCRASNPDGGHPGRGHLTSLA
jgi:hypothetical protein